MNPYDDDELLTEDGMHIEELEDETEENKDEEVDEEKIYDDDELFEDDEKDSSFELDEDDYNNPYRDDNY